MILSYYDRGKKKRHRIKARVTTEHEVSIYGQPVIVLEDGDVLDFFSWKNLGYRVVQAGKREMPLLKQMGLV